MSQTLTSSVPRHVAIIMDGNGRWARARFMPRIAGHKVGAERARDMVRACAERGIGALTLFAFSSENWQRPDEEVSGLMELFVTALERELPGLAANSVRMEFIGERKRLPEKLQRRMMEAETVLAQGTGLRLNIAMSYGGQWDITQAVNHAIAEKQGIVETIELSPQDIAGHLSMSDQANVDLVIRTGGEYRISNFVLWQAAYAELYFCETLWPEFTVTELELALAFFAKRQRRFGKTGDQYISSSTQGES